MKMVVYKGLKTNATIGKITAKIKAVVLVTFLNFFYFTSVFAQPREDYPLVDSISDFFFLTVLLDVMDMSGQIDSTKLMIDKVLDSFGDEFRNEEKAYLYCKAGIIAKQKENFQEAIQKFIIADSLINIEIKEAIKIVEKEKEDLWSERQKLSSKVDIYKLAGRPDNTETEGKLEKLRDSKLSIQSALGHVYRLDRQYEKSHSLFQRILDTNPHINSNLEEKILLELAKILKEEEKNKEAIKAYTNLLDTFSISFHGSLKATNELALIYYSENKILEAEKLLDEIIQEFGPSNINDCLEEFIEIKQSRGIIFAHQGRFEEAEKEFLEITNILDTLIYIEPSFKTDIYLNFALLYSKINKPDKTIDLLNQVIKSTSDELKLLIAKICYAEALIKVNEWENAKRILDNIESNPLFYKLSFYEQEKYYRTQGSIYKQYGNFFLSSEYLTKSNDLKDSITSDFTYYSTQSIKQSELLYQESEAQISNLHHKLAIKEELHSKSKMSYGIRMLILLSTLLVASFFAVIFYKRFSSKKSQIEELSNLNKNVELEKKSLEKKFIHVQREKILLSKEVEALENINEVIALDAQEKQKITMQNGTVLLSSEILYVQNKNYNVYIYFSGEDKPLIEKNYLIYYEQRMLPPLFFKVHRSFIVNIRQIKNWKIFGKKAILMKNGYQVNVAKGYRATFFSHLEVNLDKSKHQ